MALRDLELAVYNERKRTYHMLRSIAEAAETETSISKKLEELVKETEKEAEELYLLASDRAYGGGDMYE